MLGAEDIKNTQVSNLPNLSISDLQSVSNNSDKPKDIIIPGEVARSKIADMFGVNTKDIGKYDHDINRIIQYVNEFNPKTVDDIVFYVKSLSARVGNNNLEQQIKTISRYLYLNDQKTLIERDIERMTRWVF